MYNSYKYVERNNTRTVYLGSDDCKGAIMFDMDDRLMSAMYQHVSYSEFVVNIERIDQIALMLLNMTKKLK